jgi:hypothetical protein
VELLGREMAEGNFSLKVAISTLSLGIILHDANMRRGTGRLYFPSEGRCAEEIFFFALKNTTPSAGFEKANLGNKG